MAIYRTDRAVVAAKEESTFGTNPISGGNASWIGLVSNVDAAPPTVEWRTYPAVGTDRHIAVVAEGKHEMADITFPVILQRAEILQYIFEGKLTITDSDANGGSSTGNNTHIFGPLGDEHGQTGGTQIRGDIASALSPTTNAPLKSLTLELNYPDPVAAGTDHFVRYYTGCKINEATFSVDSSGELIAELNFLGAGVNTPTSSPTRSTPDPLRTTNPYMFYQGSMLFFGTAAETTVTRAGIVTFSSTTTYSRITDFRLTVANNLKNMYYLSAKSGLLGGKYALDVIPGQRDITLDCTVVLDDETSGLITTGALQSQTLWERLEDEGTGQNSNAPFNVELRFARTALTDEIRFQLFDCWITRAPHNIPDTKQEVPVDVSLQARKCRIVVVNNRSSAQMDL